MLTKEEKDLILKVCYSSLLYGITVYVEHDTFYDEREPYKAKVSIKSHQILDDFGNSPLSSKLLVRPYLRSMSTMTEEEAITIFKIIYGDDAEFSSVEVSDNCIEIWDYDYNEDGFSERTVCTIYFEEIVRSMEVLDYLLSRYFDIPHWNKSEKTYKTMIEKGLALEATKGMYK